VLTVYDTNCRRSHSCAIFEDPDTVIRELCYCGTLLSSWHHFCGNVSHCAHNSCHSENMSVLGCVDVPLVEWFLLFWRFLSPSECWEQPMQRHSIYNPEYLKSHQHHCQNVGCQVSVLHVHMWTALCCMHCIVLTHPPVNLAQYPFDFHVFSPLKKALIWIRWSQKGGAVILAEASGVFNGGDVWTIVSKECWSQL
jgi:hypothetical protein